MSLSPVVSVVELTAGGIDPAGQDVPILNPLEVKRNSPGDERLRAPEVLDDQPGVPGPGELDGVRHPVDVLGDPGVGEVDGGHRVGPGGEVPRPQDTQPLNCKLQSGPGLGLTS